MAHNDIYTKFMIEYDKANVTSSYPSLTKYEIAVILNKAYLALIAQKTTGNNYRQSPFEADVKSISDLQELVVTTSISPTSDTNLLGAENTKGYKLPDGFLYYVSSVVTLTDKQAPVTLITHEYAQRFKKGIANIPWIKNAVGCIENNKFIILYDNYDGKTPGDLSFTYIKEPEKFTNDFNGTFELNDTMAEELISLAVLMALENVESSRLQAKAQLKGLEA